MLNSSKINPPWIEYPGYPPGDTFWRQSGEAWFAYIWEPFWKQLNAQEQQDYLTQWNAPQEWRLFYSHEFQEWLHTDDE
jgi:hypothetical protein